MTIAAWITRCQLQQRDLWHYNKPPVLWHYNDVAHLRTVLLLLYRPSCLAYSLKQYRGPSPESQRSSPVLLQLLGPNTLGGRE